MPMLQPLHMSLLNSNLMQCFYKILTYYQQVDCVIHNIDLRELQPTKQVDITV